MTDRRMPSRFRRGFTLLELMVSVSILVVMMLVVARIFTESSRAYTIGTSSAQDNSGARAVMDFIAKELSTAICTTNFTFALQSNAGPPTYYGWQSDILNFVSYSQTPSSTHRDIREIRYILAQMVDANTNALPGRYRLMRWYRSQTLNSYTNAAWYTQGSFSSDPLVENVSAFEVWAYDETGTNRFNYVSSNYEGKLPAWVEIYLEVLNEKDAALTATMAEPRRSQIAAQRAKGYVIRVNFPNREGYANGY